MRMTLKELAAKLDADWDAWANSDQEWSPEDELAYCRLVYHSVLIEVLLNGWDDYCPEDIRNYAESAGRRSPLDKRKSNARRAGKCA